jgi:hypothetical protein
MAEKEFQCVACGAEYDRSSAVQECRMCHRTHCTECIDEQGICVPCKDVKAGG